MPIIRIRRAGEPDEDRPIPTVRARVRQMPSETAAGISRPAIPPNGDKQAENEPKADYEIGYGKPPRHSQFKPGQSGNLKGRPKAAKGLHSIVRETLTKKVAVRTAKGTQKISRIEAVLQKTLEQAMKGNPRALAELIKLYGNAVPEPRQDNLASELGADVTATDAAILQELAIILRAGSEDRP